MDAMPTASAATPSRGLVPALGRWWPEVLAGLLWFGALVALIGMPVSHDVVWQLWIARHMNGGVGLYSWIMEVNPPLWYWMAQPIDFISAATGIPATTVLCFVVFLCIGASLGLSAALLAERPAGQRAAVLGAAFFVLVWACLSDFAQRDHLCLIGAIPYALLIARRVEGRPVHWGIALSVAVLATPMFALKHYFALVPMLLEAWLIWRLRRQWRPVRPETGARARGATIYAAAVLLCAREYITELVPLLSLSYGDLRSPLRLVLINRMTLATPVAALYFWHFRRELAAPAQAMLVLLAAFFASYWLQFKGWGYHIDPVASCAIMTVAAHLALRPARRRLRAREWLLAAAIPAISLSTVAIEGPYSNTYQAATNRLLAPAQPGMTAMMLTTKPTKIWPMAEDKGLIWPSRYFHFWMMQSVANDELGINPLAPALEEYVARVRLETVEDFLCNPPDILIDDAASIDRVPFNILDFFLAEPRFAKVFAAYERYDSVGPFTAYRLVGELPPADGLTCQTILPKRSAHAGTLPST